MELISRKLPTAYYELDYIKNPSSAYIATGISTSASTSTVTKWEGQAGYANGSSGRRFIAAYSNSAVSHYSEFNAYNKWGCYEGYTSATLAADTLYECSMQINGSSNTVFTITVGSTTSTATSKTYQSSTMGQFVLFRLDSTYYGNGQIIGPNKIYVGGTLVRNFIPAERKSDSVAGMYDLVNDVFYPSNSSVAFTAGNRIITADTILLNNKDVSQLALNGTTFWTKSSKS